MAVSQARVLHSNPTATPAQGAKILRFRKRELPEQPFIKDLEARGMEQGLKPELKKRLSPGQYRELMGAIAKNPELYPAAVKEALTHVDKAGLGRELARDMEAVKGIKAEEQRESKAKGGFRRSGDLPTEHYVLAWIVWYCYIRIMLSSGFRVADYIRHTQSQLHEPLKRAS